MRSRKIISVLILIALSTQSFFIQTPVSEANNTKNNYFNFSESNKDKNKKFRTSSDPKLNYIEGEVIIKYKKNKKQLLDSKVSDFKKKGFRVNSKENKKGIASIKSSNKKTKDIIKELKNDKDIEYIQPNYIYKHQGLDNLNDSYKDNLWGLYNNGQIIEGQAGNSGSDMSWDKAINIFTGSINISNTGVIVAVLDTGVAYNHPDLINNMWDGNNCLDYEGNYLGGCIHGYDFDDNDKEPMLNSEDHGTHVAGTIAASMNNLKGVMGVNPNAKIMALKHENFTSLSIVNSVYFAKYNGAKIINASFGGYGRIDYMLYDAIRDFGDNGGLFIAAAGNNASNHDLGGSYRMFPAGFGVDNVVDGITLTGLTNIISVAAIDNQDSLASFSDYGSNTISIGAPGVSIYSTTQGAGTTPIYNEDFSSEYFIGNTYGFLTGGTNNNFGANYGFSGIWGDVNYPFMTGSNSSYIEKQIDISNVNMPNLNFNIWCDAGKSGYPLYTDYMSLSFSTGGIFTEIDKIDYRHMNLLYSSAINSSTGYYGMLSYDLSNYKSSNFKLKLSWISDDIESEELGCFIYGDPDSPFEIVGLDDGTQESYGFKDGTSMATPHVVGLASLAWSYRPDLNYLDIKNAILNSGDDIASLSGKTITGKKINTHNTLLNLTEVSNIQELKLYNDNTKQDQITTEARIDNPYIEWVDNINPYTLSGYIIQVSNNSGEIIHSGTTTNKYYTGFTVTQNGNYNFSVYEELLNSNTGGLINVSNIYFDVSPIGTLSFLNGTWTNTGITSLSINTDKISNYSISGDLTNTYTGDILTGSTLDVTLTPGDGEKNIILNLEDEYGNISTTTGSIILDTIAPEYILNIYNGLSVTGSLFTLTGSTTDIMSGVGAVIINGSQLSGNLSNWVSSINLVGGENLINFEFGDLAGNNTNTGVLIYRNSISSDIGSQILSISEALVSFKTDINSTGAIMYGTSSGNLNNYIEGVNGINHSITLTNLDGNASYYYQVFGKDINGTGQISEIHSFKMPEIVSDFNQEITSTGSVVFSGSTGSGIDFGSNSGALTLHGNDGLNAITLSLSGLSIISDGNNWNGILQGPEIFNTGASINDLGYSKIGNVYQIGNSTSGLSLSGQVAGVSINLGPSFNGKNLRVYRANDGVNFSNIGTCLVSNGICNFNTDHFSLFVFSEPTDTTPNNFSFTAVSNSELSSEIISQAVTITGINKESPISITNGSYSINNGVFTNQAGVINNNDSVRIKFNSSSSYSTNATATLSIGGVSGNFVVITKSQPVSSGGGGGGGGGISKDYCPGGDNSPSYYDGTCGSVINSGSTQISSNKVDIVSDKSNIKNYITKFDASTTTKINFATETIQNYLKYKSIKSGQGEKKLYISMINALKKKIGAYNSIFKKSIINAVIKNLERKKNLLKHDGTLVVKK